MLVFRLQEQHQNHALLSSFFNRNCFSKQTVCNSRKLQVHYLALVGNDSRSSLRRQRYSLFIDDDDDDDDDDESFI